MNDRTQVSQPVLPARQEQASPARAPYAPPRIERTGHWRALTLQLSLPPIFPLKGHALFEKTGEE